MLALVVARKCPPCGERGGAGGAVATVGLGNDWPAGLVIAAAPDRADGEASYRVRLLTVAGAGAVADHCALAAADAAAVTALRAGGAGAAALAEKEKEDRLGDGRGGHSPNSSRQSCEPPPPPLAPALTPFLVGGLARA